MRQLPVTHLLVHEDVLADPLMRARAERMRPNIQADEELVVDDAKLESLVEELKLHHRPRHGAYDEVPMILVFNRYLFDADHAARKEAFPNLYRGYRLGGDGSSGRGGYDWRDSGSPAHRAKTGTVCQPAWQLHTIVGCPFRCGYCNLGWIVNMMMNLEEFVGRLDGYIGEQPTQTLWQWDNNTDVSEFEPEYGGSELFIDYFAHKPDCFLELYVGKSNNVENLLTLDHRGKTTCCWSIASRHQAELVERQTASMEARLRSVKKCQDAGYPVRLRYSPIVPMRNWREEIRDLVETTFELCQPELITFETLRYLNFEQLQKDINLDWLDPEFVEVMRNAPVECEYGGQIPEAFRRKVYQAVIEDIERCSPNTPYAFCREARTTWEHFGECFAKHGQHPDGYVCNCGPMSAPNHVLLTP